MHYTLNVNFRVAWENRLSVLHDAVQQSARHRLTSCELTYFLYTHSDQFFFKCKAPTPTTFMATQFVWISLHQVQLFLASLPGFPSTASNKRCGDELLVSLLSRGGSIQERTKLFSFTHSPPDSLWLLFHSSVTLMPSFSRHLLFE